MSEPVRKVRPIPARLDGAPRGPVHLGGDGAVARGVEDVRRDEAVGAPFGAACPLAVDLPCGGEVVADVGPWEE